MKQKYLAVQCLTGLAVGLCMPAAYAEDSVRLYGAIDAGIATIDNGAPGGSHSVAIVSGVLRPSMIGFLGAEELGGGVKAVFRLEAGFDADTGAMKTYQGNPATATASAPGGASVTGLFNRRAFVGIAGNFGTLTIGRDYTPIYWAALDTDVMGLTLFGNLQESVALSGTGSDRYGRVSNGLFYVSPEVGGFTGRAMLSMGSESAGGVNAPPGHANRMFGVSGKYAYRGLVGTLVYQEVALPRVAGTPPAFTGATANRTDLNATFKYTFNRYSMSTGYLQIRQPTSVNTNGSVVWVGATVPLVTGLIHVNAQRLKQRVVAGPAKDANVYGIAYVRPLSKTTSLYASYGQVDNGITATFPLVSADTQIAPGAVGAKVSALALGMMHSF